MSNHAIPVVQVGELTPHPDADRLSITSIGGWQVVVGKDQFNEGDHAIYIPPDFTVPVDRPEFAFLAKSSAKDRARIKVAKLRGQISQGLLIPLPEFVSPEIGGDVSGLLGIERYEPPQTCSPNDGKMVSGPPTFTHKFDVESYQNHLDWFISGERLVVTEKIHGANCRFVYCDGKLHVGSRTNWWEETENNTYWKAFRSSDSFLYLAEEHEGITFYGEAYGAVQSLRYGCDKGEVRLRLFAAMRPDGSWVDSLFFFDSMFYRDVPTVPYLGIVNASESGIELAKYWAERDSSLADNMREGVVLVPAIERRAEDGTRVALKIVSNRYLMGGK